MLRLVSLLVSLVVLGLALLGCGGAGPTMPSPQQERGYYVNGDSDGVIDELYQQKRGYYVNGDSDGVIDEI